MGLGSLVKDVGSLTRGLVGDSELSVLPNVSPLTALIFTVLSQLPILYQLWKHPTHNKFMHALILCGYGSFLFGWHVHEKAILMVLIPLRYIIYLMLA
jgi:alpha-1,3-glucosyltransferase